MRVAVIGLVLLVGACTSDAGAPDDLEDVGKGDDLTGTARDSKLPDPNAEAMPPADWKPPAVSSWPDAYVIFNNTGCGHDCTQADQTALTPRAVMIKMLSAAIRSVKSGGTVRVANFNIATSAPIQPLADALQFAMEKKHATVKIVMDSAQDTAGSGTNKLAAAGAKVRFLRGMIGGSSPGIMHSKMVVVDDKVVLSGSNNFSGSGVVTNEENSVVLHGAGQKNRILAYTCQFDRMFEAGVEPGDPQRGDTDPVRVKAVKAIDGCETEDQLFPPAGLLTDGKSHAFDALTGAIANAGATIDVAPDIFAHPGLVSALAKRAREAKASGKKLRVRLVLDASEDTLSLPAFGECLSALGERDGTDIEVRYWPGNHEIFQMLHHKFMLIDAAQQGGVLWNGSANYSSKALKFSFENVARYPASDFGDVVEVFAARFERVWKAAKTRAELAKEDKIDVPACPNALDTF